MRTEIKEEAVERAIVRVTAIFTTYTLAESEGREQDFSPRLDQRWVTSLEFDPKKVSPEISIASGLATPSSEISKN
jgi:hypothetical protein